MAFATKSANHTPGHSTQTTLYLAQPHVSSFALRVKGRITKPVGKWRLQLRHGGAILQKGVVCGVPWSKNPTRAAEVPLNYRWNAAELPLDGR